MDATKAAGITFQQRSGKKQALDIVQTSAGGVGLLDYDGDGQLDIFFVQGAHAPGDGNRLYRNRGDGTFEDVTARAGVEGHGYGMGCAVGDWDADGRPDIYVCNYGRCELFRNRGDGTFEEIAHQVGADVQGCCVSAVFADLDEDGWPDLYVTRYIAITATSKMLCSHGDVPISCDPQFYPPQPGVFLHNAAGKRFQDRTRASGLVDDGRGMAACVADVNEDGHPDLFVTNDTSANALFLGHGKGHFTSDALVANVGYGELGVAEANMGCDVGDYDADGRPDLFVGVMQDRSSLLFHNDGNGLFSSTTRSAGLAELTAPVVTWGCGFLDYNNDGLLDLFQSNGHVHDRVEQFEPDHRFLQPRQLFENDGKGSFIDRSAVPVLSAPAAGRGVAFGDLDNDGDVDLVVSNLDGAPMVLLNQSEKLGHHWLRIKLVGKAPNTSPEGAVLLLKTPRGVLRRHLHTAYSYASASDARIHFGLGRDASVGPLTVRWPSGGHQEVEITGVDQELTVTQH